MLFTSKNLTERENWLDNWKNANFWINHNSYTDILKHSGTLLENLRKIQIYITLGNSVKKFVSINLILEIAKNNFIKN